MRLLEFSDASSFLSRSNSFLLKAEAENNLLLSSLQTLARASVTRSQKLSFFVVEKDANVACAALNSTERRLLISNTEPEIAEFISTELSKRDFKLKGILGPTIAVRAFAEKWRNDSGRSFSIESTQKILRLEKLTPQTTVNGLMRLAKEKDIKLLIRWSLQFVKESGLDETPEESEEIVRRKVENRSIYLWEDTSTVAMAGYSGPTANGIRINMVYTDPKVRSRGFGRSLVYSLCHKLLVSGHKYCFLYVDSKNLAALHVYEKIGFKLVGEFTDLR